MENNEEQLSSAENEEVIESENADVENTQANESDALENSETEEQKNERALQEEATRRQAKEEKRALGVQRRIDELTAKNYQEKARADALQTVLDNMNKGSNHQQQSDVSKEPQRDQFESYEDFLEAKASFKAEQIVQKHLEQYQTQQKESTTRNQAEQSRKDAESKFLERRQVLEKEIPDYRDAVEDWEPNLPNSVVEMLVKLPEGPLISYHMAKNPALEAQFRDQPEYMHGVILGQLIMSLKSTLKVSTAPAAGKTVSTSKATSSKEAPSDPEQYYAWAQKNLR